MLSPREIKFRAWDKKQNELLSWEDIRALDMSNIYPFLYMISKDNYELMQYTGLNELYESDIVETSHHIYDGGLVRRNQVSFKDYCWRLVAIGEDNTNDIPLGLYANYPESIKKIGNIYENPEFLK